MTQLTRSTELRGYNPFITKLAGRATMYLLNSSYHGFILPHHFKLTNAERLYEYIIAKHVLVLHSISV